MSMDRPLQAIGAPPVTYVREQVNLYGRHEQVDSAGLHLSMVSPYVINVKDFGAKGDDSTDDTAAIKAARDYGVANYATRGYTLYFPEGRYRVSSVIAFASNYLNIVGSSRGNSQIWNTDAFVSGDILTFGAQSQLTIQDIAVWSNVARTGGSGIALNGTTSATLTRMFVWNQFIGINISASAQLIAISELILQGADTANCIGINIDSNNFGDIQIGPNVILSQIGATRPGIGISLQATLYVGVIATDVVGWKNCLNITPPANEAVTWSIFNSVLLDNAGEHGVNIISNGATSPIRGLTFINCWASTAGQTGGGGGLGNGFNINCAAGGVIDDVQIIGTRIINNKNHGVSIGALPTNIRVVSNTIMGNGTQTANTYDGVTIAAGASNFTVSYNRIGGAYGSFTNQQRYSVNLAAGTSNNYQITNNECSGNTTANSTGTIFDGGTLSGQGMKWVGENTGHSVKGTIDRIVASSGALNTTETILLGGVNKCPVPKNSLTAGDTFRFKIWGTCTATVANNTTIRIRIGTAGSTADGAIFTVAFASAAAGTTIPFELEGTLTIRTLGAAATVHGTMRMHNQNVTSNATASVGISIFQSQVFIPTFATFDSTAVNYIEVTHVTAATTTTNTFQGGVLVWE